MPKPKRTAKNTQRIHARKELKLRLIEKIHSHSESLTFFRDSARKSSRLASKAEQRNDLETAKVFRKAASEARELAEFHRQKRIELKEKKKVLFPES